MKKEVKEKKKRKGGYYVIDALHPLDAHFNSMGNNYIGARVIIHSLDHSNEEGFVSGAAVLMFKGKKWNEFFYAVKLRKVSK